MTGSLTTYALRLKPGADLEQGIRELLRAKGIGAGWIMGCAGTERLMT